ncbi:unnamed protein product, partial [Laminaria digitata]
MTADTSPCDYCEKQGHHVRICRYKTAGQKWCSLHKTTSHSDEGC